MSLALRYWMRDAHHCSGPPVSKMIYTVSSGTLNSTVPYHWQQEGHAACKVPYRCASGGDSTCTLHVLEFWLSPLSSSTSISSIPLPPFAVANPEWFGILVLAHRGHRGILAVKQELLLVFSLPSVLHCF